MSWDIPKNKDFYHIRDLILQKEWTCVSFSARFKKINKIQFTTRRDCTILANREDTTNIIKEAIMLTGNGLILPILEPGHIDNSMLDYYLSSIDKYIRKLHSIMGLTRDVSIIETFLPSKPTIYIEYYLMTLTEKTLIKPELFSFPDILIKNAQVKDAEKLYTLQKKYEIEEVFTIPSHFNPRICLAHLKSMLKNEIVIYAEKNKIPIAKAQTNARGFYTDQIGGVYTIQEERRKGYALYLLYFLLKRIFKNKLIISLFVKKSNTPAISLYKKLGFELRENFRISYY